MGCWDELCLLCGVTFGPRWITGRTQASEDAQAIAEEIRPNDSELYRIVEEALMSTFSDKDRLLSYVPWWTPEGVGYEGYSTGFWVAVGYFNVDGFAPIRDGKIPDGRRVQVRHVNNPDSGSFNILWVWRKGRQVWKDVTTCCSALGEGRSNVFLCNRCYSYLETWLDRESLPRTSPNPGFEGRMLSPLAGELYEIVNSRKAMRDRSSGLLPELDYGGIEASLEQWQTNFMPCRRGSDHIARAINAGLRGKDLIPAILRDCRSWMFTRPDVWPEPPRRVDTAPVFAGFSLDGQVTDSPFMKLPNELLVPLLSELPLLSILSISSTCRHLRNLITAPTFLDVVLKEAIAAGSLRWLLPLASLDDEPVRAYNAVRLWLPEEYRPRYISPPPPMDIDWDKGEYKSDDEDSEDEDLPVRQVPALPVSPSAMLLSPHLDRLAFLRACWESDSMMNRKRLWGQVKQFERIWADYRLHGWHVDRFYSSDDLKPTDNIIRE